MIRILRKEFPYVSKALAKFRVDEYLKEEDKRVPDVEILIDKVLARSDNSGLKKDRHP